MKDIYATKKEYLGDGLYALEALIRRSQRRSDMGWKRLSKKKDRSWGYEHGVFIGTSAAYSNVLCYMDWLRERMAKDENKSANQKTKRRSKIRLVEYFSDKKKKKKPAKKHIHCSVCDSLP